MKRQGSMKIKKTLLLVVLYVTVGILLLYRIDIPLRKISSHLNVGRSNSNRQLTTPSSYGRKPTSRPISRHANQQVKIGEQLRLQIPVSIPHQKPFLHQCQTCSLVSSSGQLLNSSAGEEIDSSDCVIRMNDAPTKGYERDVGTHTTIRVIGHSNLKSILSNPRNPLVGSSRENSDHVIIAWLYKTNIYKDFAYKTVLNFSQVYKNINFYIHTTEMMRSNNEMFLNETGITRNQAQTWLTTGWHAMLLAIEICSDITVYGMVDDEYCMRNANSTIPYHYYNNGGKTRLECEYYMKSEHRLRGGHLFVTEKYIFGRWAQKYGIRFKHPRWKRKTYNDTFIDTPFMKLYREKKGNLSTEALVEFPDNETKTDYTVESLLSREETINDNFMVIGRGR